VPELPDIEVFAYNLKAMFCGKKLLKLTFKNANKLPDPHDELVKHLEGSVLKDIYRSGKEFRLQFSNGTLLGMHLMLTGDIFPFEGENERKLTIIEFHFEGGKSFALTDRLRNAHVKLHPVDKGGIDALSKEMNFKNLKSILSRKTKVKDVLLNQDIIRGIGNGYSDEILWEAKISPYSSAAAIPDEKIKDLAKAIKKVLTKATEQILKAYPGLITGEVKDFLKIHRQTISPTGVPIKVQASGMRKTYYTDEQVLYK
jgi:formamidopyrimidine-DNA glycosylase